jgi:hypothetical protein
VSNPLTGVTAVRMIWQDSNVAIGETYYNTQPPGFSGSAIYANSLALFKARSALMGAGIVPVSVRMSLLGTRRAYIKLANSDVQPVPVGSIAITVNPAPAFAGNNASNVVDGSAAQGPDAVFVDAYGSKSTSHAKKYMAGCPNVLIRTNPLGPYIIGDAAWGNLFNTYATTLTTTGNNWVMKVLTVPPPSGIATAPVFALDQTNTYLTITCPTFTGNPGVGAVVTIHGAKMSSRAYKAPNGNYKIIAAPTTSGGNTTYTLGVTFAQRFPYIMQGFGTAQIQDYSTDTYTAVLLGREGEHKRGNSVLAPRGRRKNAQQIAS